MFKRRNWVGERNRKGAMLMHNYSGSVCSFCKGNSDTFPCTSSPKRMQLLDIGRMMKVLMTTAALLANAYVAFVIF